MEPLLYLVHRIPYPPNKGDKVRSYHLLKHLAAHYEVHLGTFVDEPRDWTHIPILEGLCADVHAEPLHPARARVRSLAGLVTGQALTLPYYWNRGMSSWVQRAIDNAGIRRAVVFSSAMAQYLPDKPDLRRVVDFVDVDSDKWRQYADKKRWPMNWVYRRESRELLKFERRTAETVDASAFVSEEEAALFRNLTGLTASRIHAVHNGVDFEFFDPGLDYPNPYSGDGPVMVFTGAMDYWPNVDAAKWFATEILPRVRASRGTAEFYIVGARPTDEVMALIQIPGVTVTGTVDDMRPYLARAALAVAPLRIARGIQNKVLEALAMEKMVVATGEAAEGIGRCPALRVVVDNSADSFAEEVINQLEAGDGVTTGKSGRNFVCEHFDWQTNLSRFSELLEAG
ncbi:MAG: TIGR03087 family PEP-CTERM/XrtA system glycosyltransferase [Gammaproteobacteria bacterium]|nr:TIGR03087 family PEP-CTERM/XrtA system glycosyltransferase [Gammaproteobacteria bacterium]